MKYGKGYPGYILHIVGFLNFNARFLRASKHNYLLSIK